MKFNYKMGKLSNAYFKLLAISIYLIFTMYPASGDMLDTEDTKMKNKKVQHAW